MRELPKKQVQGLYVEQSIFKDRREEGLWRDYEVRDVILRVLRELFGSKCLPDNDANEDNFATKEPKPEELKFKFKVGDKVKVNLPRSIRHNTIGTVVFAYASGNAVNVDFGDDNEPIYCDCDCLEPYTEPEEPTCTDTCTDDCPSQSRNLSQETANCDKCNDRRLHIAAMAMQGILGNADRMKSYEQIAMSEPYEDLSAVVACNAVRYADAIIAECEKGDGK